MSTVTSSSVHGSEAMKSTLKEESLTSLITELACRLIGPEKAKLLNVSGINLEWLSALMTLSLSTPGSVKMEIPSITSTSLPHYAEKELPKPSFVEVSRSRPPDSAQRPLVGGSAQNLSPMSQGTLGCHMTPGPVRPPVPVRPQLLEDLWFSGGSWDIKKDCGAV